MSLLSAARRLLVSTRTFSSAAVPEALWKLGRLNHIAIATPDLAKSASLYKNILGAEISEPQDLPDHGKLFKYLLPSDINTCDSL